jgi:lipopolysaccharide transport system permease protein
MNPTLPVIPAPASIVEIKPDHRLLSLDFEAIWRYRGLLYFLVWRELKVRYKQAVIGVGWAILQPAFAAVIFTAVFGYFAKLPSDGAPYALFALSAVIAWTYFAEAFRRSASGIVDDAELVRKIYFPRLIIPLAGVLTPLVDFAFSLVALFGVMYWYAVLPTPAIVLLPVFLLLAMLFALGLGLCLAPLNVRFRDVKHALPFLIQIGMYASPVVYPVGLVPERWRLVYSLNPMVGVIEGFRWSLLGTRTPDFQAILLSLGVVATLLAAGLVYFRKMERSFADVI